MKTLNAIENVLIVGGVALSIENIESLLGVILLGVQIFLILWKLGYALYKRIKNKDYKGVEEDVQNSIKSLKDLEDGLKDRNGK